MNPRPVPHRIAWAVLLLLHVAAVCRLLPPAEAIKSAPILGADHPAHAHRVHVYGEALRGGYAPWGFDPAVSAGVVMRPTQDAGAKPQQFLGAIAPGMSPGQVIRAFAFVAALLLPVGTILASRSLGLPEAVRIWILLLLLILAWTYENLVGFSQWGLVAFASAGYLSPLVLALFLRFFERPAPATYAAAVGLLSAQTMLHVLGAVVIAPALAWLTLTARPLPARWRAAALAAPAAVVAINAFWFVPFVLDMRTPRPPGRDFAWYPEDLTYTSVGQLLAALSWTRIAALVGGVVLAGLGTAILRHRLGNRAATAFGMAIAWGLLLKFGGSFLPGIATMQPSRFLLPTAALITFPAGVAAAWLCDRIRLPQTAGMAVALAGALGLAAAGDRLSPAAPEDSTRTNYAGALESDRPTFLTLGARIPLPTIVDPLTDYVLEQTLPGERLLVQTRIQAEPKILARHWGREVVGNTYPDQHDPAQFLRDRLWGRPLADWDPRRLAEALHRWGIQVAAVDTPAARRLLAEVAGDEGEDVGGYRVFRFPGNEGRFLVGRGRLSSRVNRIDLADLEPEGGRVVLRYRYHPAWEAEPPARIARHEVPEDPTGFIELADPPRELVLHFRPWKLFSARWPEDSPPDVPAGGVARPPAEPVPSPAVRP